MMRHRPGGGAALFLVILVPLAGCSREIDAEPVVASALLATLAVADRSPPPGPAWDEGEASLAARVSEAHPARSSGELSSVLYSEHDAEITTRIYGVVASIAVELGDQVRAGQLLAVLRDEAEQAGVEAANAALDLALLEHERSSRLLEQSLITQAEVDQTTFRLRAAEAAAREARVRLEYTRVRAPFDGAVTRRFVRVGQSVEEREPIVRVTALQPLRVLVRVPELASLSLSPGQAVTLRSLSNASIPGRISRVAPAVDPVSGTVEVLISIANPGGLRPGSTVAVELPSAGTARP
jgi:membrane fusion protein, multidrug efflux system